MRSSVELKSVGAISLAIYISIVCRAVEPIRDEVPDDVPSVSQADEKFQKVVLPFLTKNCLSCHGNVESQADLSLDKYQDESSMRQSHKIWNNVISMLRKHEMPPKDEPLPIAEECSEAIEAIESILTGLDCGQPGNSINAGRVTIRRLNRTQYNNTIRDLVGIDFHPADDFPADDVGYGFDNIGDVLSFSPLLAEKYLIAAEAILEETIVIIDPPKRTPSRVGQLRPTSATAVVEQSGFITLEEGDYVITARVYADQSGDEVARARMRLTFQATNDSIESEETDIPGTKEEPTIIEMRFRALKGSYRIGVLFLNPHDEFPANAESEEAKADIAALIATQREQDTLANGREVQNVRGENQRQLAREARQAARDAAEKASAKLKELGVKTRTLFVRSIDTDGPENPPPPIKPVPHMRLMEHSDGITSREAAEEIVSRFATRAFRRAVRPNEIADCMLLFDRLAKQNNRFELCVRAALLRVLVSPYFLYRVELDPADVQPGETYAVNEHELANRLSYFLWNSMPDDQLRMLAENGKLRMQLESQVERMINDPKSNSFVEDFAEQWLVLRKLDIASPDPALFPEFTPALREAMVRESLLFFGELVRKDRSILDLLSADFTFVNEPLAKLYGVHNVRGNDFVRVAAPPHRGGILTQASILTLTSNATRTSPVKRGKFVLEQILNTPPPPAPADVPPLEEDKILTGSLRQVMEQHRQNAMCASCHAKMDPLGFAFENFNAIGGWRDLDGAVAVNASGVLPDGQSFNGPDQLVAIMQQQKELFVRCVVEKMLTYAVGRGLEYYDKCAVDNIMVSLQSNEYKFSKLFIAIVMSDPFQMRTTASSPLQEKPK